MSRKELADEVNDYLWRFHATDEGLNQHEIGRIERGEVRWPGKWRRAGMRAVLGVDTDAELGFYFHRRSVAPPENRREEASWLTGTAGTGRPPPTRSAPLDRVAASLTDRAGRAERAVPDQAVLTSAVVSVKRLYQSGRYRDAGEKLPGTLDQVRTAAARSPESHLLQALVADAHQTACSVLLKYGEQGLAMLAADRSLAAAERSGDPVVLAASTRAMVHALGAAGHHARAVAMGLAAAAQLRQAAGPTATAGAVAVYGALLLRTATVAAAGEDRSKATAALAEADEVATRIPEGTDLHWTYFCPTNVTLHRVSVALKVGDAGQAIEHARSVKLRHVPLRERRARLLLDTAQAYLQWGKYADAVEAVCAAERAAPEEITARPRSRALVEELQHRCPPSLSSPVRALADRARVGG